MRKVPYTIIGSANLELGATKFFAGLLTKNINSPYMFAILL